jgi:hypothetical protein
VVVIIDSRHPEECRAPTKGRGFQSFLINHLQLILGKTLVLNSDSYDQISLFMLAKVVATVILPGEKSLHRTHIGGHYIL